MSVAMLVAEHLCCYDPRALAYIGPLDPPVEPRHGCICERCWTGRDTLAVALQEALDIVEACRDQIRSQPLGGDATAQAAFALLRRIRDLQIRYEPAPIRPGAA